MPRTDPLVGRALGDRYRVLGRLGAGASAAVYVAEDNRLGRRVAIKVLHPGLASDEAFLRRFQSEARAAARLRHPHIVQVYDWGEDPGGAYVVLEYLPGGSLREVLDAHGPLDPSQVAAIGSQAAQGLAHAHQRGTAHRDIKPANLLFDDDGRLAIADFGLARAMADATWTEPAGVILGTARYASPEQATGQATGTATDVYSLALVLVEAATGSVPFSADTTVATLMARQGRRVEPTPELGPLGPVVAAATDPDPAARPDANWLVGQMAALAAELPAPSPVPVVVGWRDPLEDGAGPATAEIPGTPWASPGPAGQDPTAVWAAVPAAAGAAAGNGAGGAPAADPARRPGRPRPRRGMVLAVNLALILAVVVGVGLWLALGVFKLDIPSHPVPKLTGQPLAAAEHALRAEKFGYQVETAQYSETVAAGSVVSQFPSAGSARQGTVFRLVPSKGPAPRAVPDLGGLSQAQASARLTAAGFVPKFASAYSETVPKGTVLTWTPDQGRQPKGATVTVTVSAGPAPRVIPNLAGDSYSQAAAALGNLQLQAVENEVYSTSVPVGQVVSTTPAAGDSVPRGDTVTVNVSKGPQMVVVPDVTGDSVSKATAALQAAGLAVGNVYGPPRGGRVFATDPSAGTSVVVGTAVNLYVE